VPHSCREGDGARVQQRALGQNHVATAKVETGRADKPAAGGRLKHGDPIGFALGILLDQDRVGPDGTGAPVKIRTA
jgi:hypothetical protein